MKGRFKHFNDINTEFMELDDKFRQLVDRIEDLELKFDFVYLMSSFKSLRGKVDGLHTGIKHALGEQD